MKPSSGWSRVVAAAVLSCACVTAAANEAWNAIGRASAGEASFVRDVRGRWVVLEGRIGAAADGSAARSFRSYALEVTDPVRGPVLHPVRSVEGDLSAIPSQSEVEIAIAGVHGATLSVRASAIRITAKPLRSESPSAGAEAGVAEAAASTANYAVLTGYAITRNPNFDFTGPFLLTGAEAESIVRGTVGGFLGESSYGQAKFATTFYGFFPLSSRPQGFGGPEWRASPVLRWRPSGCEWVYADPAGWLADLGYNYEWFAATSYFNGRMPLPFDKYIYVMSNSYCAGSLSLAEVGGRRIWLMNPTRTDLARLVLWGLGRNSGLADSGVLECAVAGDLSTCVRRHDPNKKIVDPFDPMGVRFQDNTPADFSPAPADFSALNKHRLGWLQAARGGECSDTDEVCTFELPPQTSFFERTWTLVPAASPEYAPKLIRIPAPDGWYSLELRAPIGNDAAATPRPAGVYLRRETAEGTAVLAAPLQPGRLGDKTVMWRLPGSRLSVQLVGFNGDRALVYARFGEKPEDACERQRPVIEAIEPAETAGFYRPDTPIVYRARVRSADPEKCEPTEFALQLELPATPGGWAVAPDPVPAVTLGPNEQRVIEFTVRSPADATTDLYLMTVRFGPSGRMDLRDEKSASIPIARAPRVDSIFSAATWVQYSNYDGKEVRSPYVAPGSQIVVAGEGLGKVGCKAVEVALPPPTELCGARVIARRGQEEIALPILGATGKELKTQYPFEGAWDLSVEIVATGERSNWKAPVWRDLAPGIFRAVATDPKSGIVLRHPDYERVTASKPIERGGYLIAYLTGLGQSAPPIELGQTGAAHFTIDPARVWVRIGGRNAPVAWAGKAPGMVGVDQVNIQVPFDAPAGRHSFRLCAGTLCSPDVDIWVR